MGKSGWGSPCSYEHGEPHPRQEITTQHKPLHDVGIVFINNRVFTLMGHFQQTLVCWEFAQINIGT